MHAIHIPYEQRIAFAAGELDEARKVAVAAHLATCGECARTVVCFRAARDIWRGDDSKEPPPATIARAQAIFTRVRQPTPKPAARPMLPWVNLFRFLQPWHLSRAVEMALVVLIAILLVVGTGATAEASQDAIPGDTLYPVKTTLEGLQIALAPDAASQVELYLAFTQMRARELVALVDRSRYGKISETARTLERQTEQSALVLDIAERQDPDRVAALARRVERVLSDNENVLVALLAVVPQEVKSAIEHTAKFCRDVKSVVIEKFQLGPTQLPPNRLRNLQCSDDPAGRQKRLQCVLEYSYNGEWGADKIFVSATGWNDTPAQILEIYSDRQPITLGEGSVELFPELHDTGEYYMSQLQVCMFAEGSVPRFYCQFWPYAKTWKK